MKRLIFSIFLIIFVICTINAQLPIFHSENEVLEYFSSNNDKLDPLEGLWVGTWSRESNSPYALDRPNQADWFFVKGSDGWVYQLTREYTPGLFRFKRIGNSLDYKWEALHDHTSSGVVSMMSLQKFDFKCIFNERDAKKMANNKNFSYLFWMRLKFTKDFPLR